MQKFQTLLILSLILLSACSRDHHANAPFQPLPFLDPEAPSSAYTGLAQTADSDDGLQPILEMGKRNLDWLKHINSTRATKLSFTSKSNTTGAPIERPSRYSPAIILRSFADTKAKLPLSMTKVLFEDGAFTDQPPVDEKTYLDLGLAVDRVYQKAARWRTLENDLDGLAENRQYDIRGYYFLNKEPNLGAQLKDWPAQDRAKQDQLRDWLITLCANKDGDRKRCDTELQEAITGAQVESFYGKYLAGGKDNYDSFFKIDEPRTGFTWQKGMAETLLVPFRDPGISELVNFLKDNIEDEWHFGEWKLNLNFLPGDQASIHLEFDPGALPHAAGDAIVMDENAPLTEYDVQWTIRHEFGHTIGFPDCYLEFYDPDAGEMINYQLDVTNLMCSRQGHIQETHYLELKRVYGQ